MTLDAKLSLMKGKMQRNKLALQKNPRAKQTTFGHFTQERFAHTLQQPDLRKQENKNLLSNCKISWRRPTNPHASAEHLQGNYMWMLRSKLC